MRGIYVLVFEVEEKEISVGSLGKLRFSGTYAYVGSAQTSIERRLSRHLSGKKRKWWHIDYLYPMDVIEVYAMELPKEKEEELANFLEKKFEVIPKFGSSDSKARGHLFKIDDREELKRSLCEFSKNQGVKLVSMSL